MHGVGCVRSLGSLCLHTPVLLPGKSHGRRSLVGCSPWGRYESDTTERLHFHSSLSCIGEGNGNPLQNSRLENPRDGGAWWAAFYGVAQSRTRLKWLSSSSSPHTQESWKCIGVYILGHDFVQWQVGLNSHSRVHCGMGQRLPSVGYCLTAHFLFLPLSNAASPTLASFSSKYPLP